MVLPSRCGFHFVTGAITENFPAYPFGNITLVEPGFAGNLQYCENDRAQRRTDIGGGSSPVAPSAGPL
jgi:hypothetical protein